MEEIAILM